MSTDMEKDYIPIKLANFPHLVTFDSKLVFYGSQKSAKQD